MAAPYRLNMKTLKTVIYIKCAKTYVQTKMILHGQ